VTKNPADARRRPGRLSEERLRLASGGVVVSVMGDAGARDNLQLPDVQRPARIVAQRPRILPVNIVCCENSSWELQRIPKFGNTLQQLLKVNLDNLLGVTVKAESRCNNEPIPGLCEKEETDIAYRGLRVATATKPADMSEEELHVPQSTRESRVSPYLGKLGTHSS
jgi:hypothetical protein